MPKSKSKMSIKIDVTTKDGKTQSIDDLTNIPDDITQIDIGARYFTWEEAVQLAHTIKVLGQKTK